MRRKETRGEDEKEAAVALAAPECQALGGGGSRRDAPSASRAPGRVRVRCRFPFGPADLLHVKNNFHSDFIFYNG